MTLVSAIRFWAYLLRAQNGKVRPGAVLELRMKRPFRGKIALREIGSDMATFREITVDEVYKPVIHKVAGVQTVIDLGANIGLASLYLVHNSPSCQILSVEPNPRSYELLVHNVQNLGKRCKTLNAAVWGTHKRLSPDPRVAIDRFSTFTLRESSSKGPDELTVQGLTMTEILDFSGFDTVDLLKIDVEGAETELFRDKDLQWLTRVGAIAIEFHNDSRKMCGFDDIMKRYEFDICSEERHTVLALKPKWGFRRSAQES